jgi:ERCC4-type nuclease
VGVLVILVDPRIGSRDLFSDIIQQGQQAQLEPIIYGDCCFEGKGPGRAIGVGIERKRLHDMLHCIDDSRYSAHQLPGMRNMYDVSILIIEGHWKPHENGDLMEGANGKWFPCKYGSRPIKYAKIRRYLISVAMSGVMVTYTRDRSHTAIDICEWYEYFQKKWDSHTSLMGKQKLVVPSLMGRPPLAMRWAAEIDDVGTTLGWEANNLFKTGGVLANAEPSEWARIKGISLEGAKKIVRQIWQKQ